jgi:diacylglycerol kinase (ATP)
MPRKILFIVNPNAGKRVSDLIIENIRQEFPKNIYYHIVIWKDKDHFDEITDLLKAEEFTDAVAVGGDGTVNRVAKSILGTNITLGIVPIGSGNGLARSLGLSMKLPEVIKQIADGKTSLIDHGLVNNIPFFCTSGIGFDAQIGNLFATSTKRGLQTYVRITINELFNYRVKSYVLEFDGQKIERKAFLITVANAGQYGNDFYIAPKAQLSDGRFHVVILKPFHVWHLPGLLTNILMKKADRNALIETYTTNKVTITRDTNDSIHFDGEPAMAEKQVVFENKPKALRVIVGNNYAEAQV